MALVLIPSLIGFAQDIAAPPPHTGLLVPEDGTQHLGGQMRNKPNLSKEDVKIISSRFPDSWDGRFDAGPDDHKGENADLIPPMRNWINSTSDIFDDMEESLGRKVTKWERIPSVGFASIIDLVNRFETGRWYRKAQPVGGKDPRAMYPIKTYFNAATTTNARWTERPGWPKKRKHGRKKQKIRFAF
jgi:hypothetical protein